MADDIKYATTTFVIAKTTSGVLDITIASLGWTPKIAKFHLAGDVEDSEGAHCRVCVGATDGTREGCALMRDVDAADTSATVRAIKTDICAGVSNAGSDALGVRISGVGDGSGSNPGPIADGWRVNRLATFTSVDVRGVVEFFGGDDLQGYVGASQIDASAVDVTAPMFQPNAVMLAGVGAGNGTGTSVDAQTIFHYGWAYDTGSGTVQKGIGFANEDAQSVSDNYSIFWTDKIGGQVNASSGSVAYTLSIGSWDPNGFTITPSADASADDVLWLALDTGDASIWVGELTTPTDAGSDWDVNDVGFEPDGISVAGTFGAAASKDSVVAGTMFGLAFFDGTRDHSLYMASEDGQNVTDCENAQNSAFLSWDKPDGTDAYTIASVTLDSGGWVASAANISAADGTARSMFGFAIAAAAAAGGATPKGVFGLPFHGPFGGPV